MSAKDTYLPDDPLWYKDAVIYEAHVKAYYDSNNDGIGDIRGLKEKLDYLEDLGVTALWLLPFYPSPLRDDGYDIADYFRIHSDYGTIADFRQFLREAHRRRIRVITELVLNHTSDQHTWFKRARKAARSSKVRDFYVWSDTPERYRETRIIFKDFESSNWSWDPVAKAYYWHRFYSHQPDLNFDNPQVHRAMFRVIDFWFGMGVDGLRLDAIPYLYEREGTNCENLPETHAFLKKLRAHVDVKFKNRMLLGEANQWPEDAAAYFGEGDECHMAFHFPIMPRMFMAIRMEDRFPIIDILEQTPAIPDLFHWYMFVGNHDELTLEMVTDEERDYMYRVYAFDPRARINLGIRRRLAPLLDNDRNKIELMNILLFTLGGTPVIYYGDEVGMGDNYYLGDRDGVRTPMQWSPDRNAGFSQVNPQKLYLPVIIDPEYHYEAVNVENQQRNPSSLLWWMKRLIAIRKVNRVFGRGNLEFLHPENTKVLTFLRKWEGETALVAVNLSPHAQVVELDLREYAGFTPVDVFSRSRFPLVREGSYVLTLGPYGYFLFLLEREVDVSALIEERAMPELKVSRQWESVFDSGRNGKLEEDVLPRYLKTCRWFGGKGQTIQDLVIEENIPVPIDGVNVHLLNIRVTYSDGVPEKYLLPVFFAKGGEARIIRERHPAGIIASMTVGNEQGVLYDAVHHAAFQITLLKMIGRNRKVKGKGKGTDLSAYHGKMFRALKGSTAEPLETQVLKAEQSNTSILYGNTFFLKLYRRLDEGVNPELEIVRFLTEKAGFSHVPPFAGALEFHHHGRKDPTVIGILQGFVRSVGDAWGYALHAVERYLNRVLTRGPELPGEREDLPSLLDVTIDDISPLLRELIGGFHLEMVRLLGKRTGELHLALSSEPDDPDFAPEPFSMLYQRSLFQSMRSQAVKALSLLAKQKGKLPDPLSRQAEEVVGAEGKILSFFEKIRQRKINSMKFRIHGDFHLGQVLSTGRDFMIIDFEGEPARALSERRLKRSPFVDVAGMIRSFHYAANSALLKHAQIRPEDVQVLEPWVERLYHSVSGIFLRSYLETVAKAPFVPADREELGILIESFLLEKVLYEIRYEINNRPDWVNIPIGGVRYMIKSFFPEG